MPVWPASLPEFGVSGGVAIARDNNSKSFQPEIGPAKIRRRGTMAGFQFPETFALSDVDMKVLDAFWKDTLADGTLTFDYKDVISGDTVTFGFQGRPLGISHKTLNAWTVTVQLYRFP